MQKDLGTQRLAAVLFTDLVGYTEKMATDELGALRSVVDQFDLLRPIFEAHEGEVIKTIGDAFMVVFPTTTQGIRAALEAIAAVNSLPASKFAPSGLAIRAGLHFGDLRVIESDLFGTTVNIAARLESQAAPGTLCVTESTLDQAKQLVCTSKRLGKHQLKGVPRRRTLYLLAPEGKTIQGTSRWIQAALVSTVLIVSGLAVFIGGHTETSPSAEPPSSNKQTANDNLRVLLGDSHCSFDVDQDIKCVERRILNALTQPLWSSDGGRRSAALMSIVPNASYTSFDLILNDGTTFHPHPCHNNRPKAATAKDLMFSIRKGKYSNFLADNLEEIGPGTVRMKLDEPFPLLEARLTNVLFLPSSVDGCQSLNTWTNPVGTGDVQLVDQSHGKYVLKQVRGGKTRTVTVSSISDAATTVQRLVNQEADLALFHHRALNDPILKERLSAANCSKRTVAKRPGDYFLYITPTDGGGYKAPIAREIRVAIAWAMDRAALKGILSRGQPWARPLGPDSLGLDPSVAPPDNRPDLARALYRKGLAKTKSLRHPILVGINEANVRLAEYLEKKLSGAGIEARVVRLNQANFWPSYHRGLVDFAVFSSGGERWKSEPTNSGLFGGFDPPTTVLDRSERAIRWAESERRYLEAMPKVILGHSPYLDHEVLVSCGRVILRENPDGTTNFTAIMDPLSIDLVPLGDSPKQPSGTKR